MLPQEVIDRVRDASDIVGVVSDHVQIKRAGRTWKGLCPFHKEKTPSFTVNPDRGIFKCFGCGIGGDVFRFVMESEKLSFPETVEHLAERAGIPLPKQSWQGPQDESVYPALEWAGTYYRRRLNDPAGEPARRYLAERGLGDLVLESYGVGWAPPGWQNLLDASQGKFSAKVLERAGLAVASDRGGHYDRFRGRVAIPIRSALGKPVGFGARTLGDEEPKYLNSPETEVFLKSRILYGLSEARDVLRDTGYALVVEGYMDVLALAQGGFLHTVASCGTAFTTEQARVLKRYVDKAVLVYDGDTPGLRAAWKAAGSFLGEGLDVRIVTLPSGHDPDSFVRQEGADRFRALVESAPGVVEFARETLLDRLETREDLVRTLAHLAAAVDDEIRRGLLLQQAAETFRIDEALLQREVRRRRGGGPGRPGRASGQREVAPNPKEAVDTLGRAYVARLLEGAARGDEDLVDEESLRETALRDLYRTWLARRTEEGSALHWLVSEEATRDFTTEILARESEGEESFDMLVSRLRERESRARGRSLREAIREAETHGDAEEVVRLQRELMALKDGPAGQDPDRHVVTERSED